MFAILIYDGQKRRGEEKRRLFEQEALPHLDALYANALHLVRNRDDASDLLQETMLRAYRFFHRFTRGTNCRAWLLTILYNTFRTNYRRAARERVSPSVEDFERAVEAESLRLETSRTNPEALLFDGLVDHEVEAALRNLPEDFRAVLLLVDIDELSYQEAAGVLSIPIGTVRSRMSRGRAMLREELRGFARAKGYIGT